MCQCQWVTKTDLFHTYQSVAVQSSITHPLSMVISLSRSKAQHFRSLSTRKHSYPSQTGRRCDWCSIYYYFMKQAENCREAKRRRRADEYLMRICLVSVYGTILQCTLQCIGGNFPKRFALRMNYIPSGRSGGVVGVVGRQNEELLRLSPGNVAFLDFFPLVMTSDLSSGMTFWKLLDLLPVRGKLTRLLDMNGDHRGKCLASVSWGTEF